MTPEERAHVTVSEALGLSESEQERIVAQAIRKSIAEDREHVSARIRAAVERAHATGYIGTVDLVDILHVIDHAIADQEMES